MKNAIKFIYAKELVLLTMLLFTSNLFSQNNCGMVAISEAESNYNIGKFSAAISSLKNCLNQKGFNNNEKVEAYRLLSMSYLAVDSVEKADENIEKLLRLKDNFETDTRDPDQFKLQVKYIRMIMRSNLISSVSKKSEKIELAPATIQIITEEEIMNRGYRDLESLFSDLPGFDVNRTFGLTYSTLFQRGYRSASTTERTLLLVDGVEDNDMWSNSAFISKQFPLSNIKRVEIIYGPASTIYGANAFAGVVNIVTKSEDDFFNNSVEQLLNTKQQNFNINARVGFGTYNTKFYDVTAATRFKDVFWSVTGRIYQSTEHDLSGYADWDGKWNANEFGANRYQNVFSSNYSLATLSQYQALDPSGIYHQVSSDSTKIIPTNYAIFKADSLDQSNYNKDHNGKSHQYSNPTNDYYISSKIRIGDLKLGMQFWNRIEGASSDYVDKYYSVSSDLTNWQVRQSFYYLRYDKNINDRLSISSFSFFRSADFGENSVLTRYFGYANQGLQFSDLLKNKQPYFQPVYFSQQSKQFRSELRTNYIINEKFDFIGGVELRNAMIQGDYVTSLDPEPILTGVAKDSVKGGNNYTIFDLGVFGQFNFQDKARHFNASIGGRLDNNFIREKLGYGSIFNPRISVIYYPGNFIFKLIYAEAFLDASSFNKFSTTSARLINNPSLQPEKARNLEGSVRYAINKTTHIEAAYYFSAYSGTLGTITVDTMGVRTTQFAAIGRARIQGLQIAAESMLTKQLSLYVNVSHSNPKSILSSKVNGSDSLVRIGDISNISANVGLTYKLLKNKLSLHLRGNFVGDKPTGKNTTISRNPNDVIPGYMLLNAAVNFKIIKQLTLQLSGNNLMDKEHFSPGIRSASGIQSSMVPQYRRTFYITLIGNLNY